MIMSIGILSFICNGDLGLERNLGLGPTCISSYIFSVLLNGSPAGFLENSRGLQQGTPYPLFSSS